MEAGQIKVAQVPVTDLRPSEYNPRKWSEEAISGLTESIKRFGLVEPILCNSDESRKNIVIGGHFRLKVAKDLGYTTIPVVYVDIPEIENFWRVVDAENFVHLD